MMQQMRMMQMQSNMPQMQLPLQPNHFSYVNSHQMNFALAAMQKQMHLQVHPNRFESLSQCDDIL
jgi:hypothetical protein